MAVMLINNYNIRNTLTIFKNASLKAVVSFWEYVTQSSFPESWNFPEESYFILTIKCISAFYDTVFKSLTLMYHNCIKASFDILQFPENTSLRPKASMSHRVVPVNFKGSRRRELHFITCNKTSLKPSFHKVPLSPQISFSFSSQTRFRALHNSL